MLPEIGFSSLLIKVVTFTVNDDHQRHLFYIKSAECFDNTDSATPEEWAAYTSRITACSLLADAKTNKVESLYFDETETMGTQWWKLRQMEKEYYLQIVTGERDIDAFDEFVTKWYENGGETITQEVREAVH